MIDRTPLLNGMSLKKRAKFYDYRDVKSSDKHNVDFLKRRGKSYRGLKLAQQSDDHKAPQLTKRAKAKGKNLPMDKYPYTINSQFKLTIGMYRIKCSKITNITIDQPIEEVREGGKNDSPNIFPGTSQKSNILVVERALVNDNIAQEFQPGVYVPGGVISIMRYDKLYKEFAFDEGIITKTEFTELNATSGTVMLQTLEITHSGLFTC